MNLASRTKEYFKNRNTIKYRLHKFLEKHSEYRPENDPGDINWQTLQREISFYKSPSNPHSMGEILERAHKQVRPTNPSPAKPIEQVKRQLEVAGVGSGGTQNSSSAPKSLSAKYKEELIRGGWNEEDIKNIEKNL